MKLLIDRESVWVARRINQVRYDDLRTYYLIGDALIVVRNGLDLHALAGQVADCAVGWDIAQPGFAPEDKIGQQRTKITVYRILAGGYDRALSEQMRMSHE